MTDAVAVELTGLTKRFREKVAVNQLSLSVPAGSFYGPVAGIVTGVVVLVLGVRSGGPLLDRTGPTLLASLRRLRGA